MCELVSVQALTSLAASPTQQDAAACVLSVKHNVHARLGFMPHGVVEHNRSNISMIRSSDVGLFLQVAGTVIRTGTVCLLLSSILLCDGHVMLGHMVLNQHVPTDQDVGVEENVRVCQRQVQVPISGYCRCRA